MDRINSSAMQQKKLDEQFPSLSGSSSNLAKGWDPPNVGSSSQELFPSLPPSHPMSFRNNGVEMSRSSSSPSWAPPLNAASIPGYLPKKVSRRNKSHSASLTNLKNTSSSSLGSSSNSLGGIWGAPVSVRPSVHVGTSKQSLSNSYRSSSSNSNSELNESMFPELPAARKKVIPRVHPVKKTTSPWESRQAINSSTSSARARNSNDIFETNTLRDALHGSSTSQNKKRGKKKRIVLNISAYH